MYENLFNYFKNVHPITLTALSLFFAIIPFIAPLIKFKNQKEKLRKILLVVFLFFLLLLILSFIMQFYFSSKVMVPKVVDLSFDIAIMTLRGNDLECKFSDNLNAQVVNQSIEPGKIVDKGTVITLYSKTTVSKDTGPSVVLEDEEKLVKYFSKKFYNKRKKDDSDVGSAASKSESGQANASDIFEKKKAKIDKSIQLKKLYQLFKDDDLDGVIMHLRSSEYKLYAKKQYEYNETINLSYTDLSSYFGETDKNNKPNGYGVGLYCYDDFNLVYFGQWENGQRQGQGITAEAAQTDDNINVYKLYYGSWDKNLPNGQGKYIQIDDEPKDSYYIYCHEGKFVDGLNDGKTLVSSGYIPIDTPITNIVKKPFEAPYSKDNGEEYFFDQRDQYYKNGVDENNSTILQGVEYIGVLGGVYF